MKKLPIFIASLNLLGWGAMSPSEYNYYDLSQKNAGWGEVRLLDTAWKNAVGEGVLTEAGETEDSYKTIWMGENKLPEFFRVSLLTLQFSRYTGSSISYSGEARRPEDNILRLHFLTRDYANGVTEEEADELVQKFRGEKEDWIADMTTYESPFDQGDVGGKASFSDDEAFTTGNRPGMFYYVMELGTHAQQAAKETTWLQGKLNYRACLHDFWGSEKGVTVTCAVKDLEDGKIAFELSPFENGQPTKDEDLKSWREEWADILREELEELESKFDRTIGDDDDAGTSNEEINGIVDGVEERAKKIKDLAPTTADEEGVGGAADDLVDRIKQWREAQKETTTPDQPGAGESGSGSAGNGNTGSGSDSGFGSGSGTGGTGVGSGSDATDSTTGTVDGADGTGGGTAGGTNGVVGGNVNGTNGTTNGAASGASGVQASANNGGWGADLGEVNSDLVKDSTLDDETMSNKNDDNQNVLREEEIEVPLAGDGRVCSWRPWLLILIGMCALSLAVWCGRKWLKERKG